MVRTSVQNGPGSVPNPKPPVIRNNLDPPSLNPQGDFDATRRGMVAGEQRNDDCSLPSAIRNAIEVGQEMDSVDGVYATDGKNVQSLGQSNHWTHPDFVNSQMQVRGPAQLGAKRRRPEDSSWSSLPIYNQDHFSRYPKENGGRRVDQREFVQPKKQLLRDKKMRDNQEQQERMEAEKSMGDGIVDDDTRDQAPQQLKNNNGSCNEDSEGQSTTEEYYVVDENEAQLHGFPPGERLLKKVSDGSLWRFVDEDQAQSNGIPSGGNFDEIEDEIEDDMQVRVKGIDVTARDIENCMGGNLVRRIHFKRDQRSRNSQVMGAAQPGMDVLRFKCQYCEHRAKEKSAIDKHELSIHKGKTPHECRYECGFRTANRSNLVRHHRIHTGEKPFICKAMAECNKEYADRKTLENHICRVHRKMSMFRCYVPNCNKSFYLDERCRGHCKKMHKDHLICDPPNELHRKILQEIDELIDGNQ